jgi:transposase-like protein
MDRAQGEGMSETLSHSTSQSRLIASHSSDWVKKAEVDSGQRAGVPTDMADKLNALERENRELRQANEIQRKASAFFATAELDRRYKP